MSRSVVIKWCMTAEEAVVIQSALNDHGFHCDLGNFNHAQMTWLYIPAMGGIDVRVPEQEADAAMACLATLEAEASEALSGIFPDMDREPLEKKHWRVWLFACLAFPMVFVMLIVHGIYRLISPRKLTESPHGPSRHL